MNLKFQTIKIEGSIPDRVNPLPQFKSRKRDTNAVYDKTFSEKDKLLFDYETGVQVLPYSIQNSYSRHRETIDLNIVVLENEILRAIFLADYGGRLISLEEKKTGKELLFKNSVFQPANLAIRNAWFSGGIEWNIGQFGHTVFTCSPLFFARMKDKNDNEFLRVYEYERIHKTFFSIDFHLPSGAKQLDAHIRIINDNKEVVPMYWWTNIALREEKNIRIFSETEDVIYIKSASNTNENNHHQFGRASLLNLPSLPDKDASYPSNFNFSSEYFFQTPSSETSPWEAAVYNDGLTFFERSTQMLQYRKMFCWGTHEGGRNWCDYLSTPGKGNYLEIQAGLSPTQLHGIKIPASSVWDFTQTFGTVHLDPDKTSGEWNTSRNFIKKRIDKLVPSDEIYSRHLQYQAYSEIEPKEIIYQGSGWAALERERRIVEKDSRPMPKGLQFPSSSIGKKEKPWQILLREGYFPEPDGQKSSSSWMIDPAWEQILVKCAKNETDNPWPLIHLGVLLYEKGENDKAVTIWEKSISIEQTSIAWRNLSIAFKNSEDWNRSLTAMEHAFSIDPNNTETNLVTEYIELLIAREKYNKAWELYISLPPEISSREQILIAVSQAAYYNEENDFLEKLFQKDFTYRREGETRIVELWYSYQSRKLAKQRKISESKELDKEVRKKFPPPKNIDFMMTDN